MPDMPAENKNNNGLESEKRLLNDIKNGSRSAMRELYDRYSGYATAVCLRYIPDRDEMQDVMQDSFVKIFTSLDSFEFRGEGSLRSWITRIVVNESLDYIRRNGRFTFTDDIPDGAEEDEPEIDAIPDDVLMEMIGRLPDGYRVVLNMYVFGGMSHKDIAEKLGIKTGTSASQYFHAKKLLAKMIDDYNKRQ